MLILLWLIVLLWGVLILIKRRRPRPLIDTVETATPSFFGRLRSNLRSWRSTVSVQPSSTAQQLQTWAVQTLAETSPLREWVMALTGEEMLILADRLNVFCVDLGFELNWLFDPMLADNLELRGAMTEAVTAYCTAVWQTVLVRDDIHAYKAFLAFEKDPQQQENREFGQQFYAQLTAKGLVPLAPPDLVLATDVERDAYVLAAIRQLALRDNFAFKQTLRTVMQTMHPSTFAAS